MKSDWFYISAWGLTATGLVSLYYAPLASWPWYVLAAGVLWMLAAYREAIGDWLRWGRKGKNATRNALLIVCAVVIVFSAAYSNVRGKAIAKENTAARQTSAQRSTGTINVPYTAGGTAVSVPQKQPTLCFPCHGSGTCNLCDGKGRLHIGTVAETVCPSCFGDGICAFCHGTGYLD